MLDENGRCIRHPKTPAWWCIECQATTDVKPPGPFDGDR
jgi:hypothetical protein